MSKRNDILNYLAYVLSSIRGQSETQAQLSASVVSGEVDTITVDVAGFFYRGAHVVIEDPGIVTANAIATVEGGSVVSATVDVPGGIYHEFITLLSEFGFILETQAGDALGTEQWYIPAITFSGDGSGANGYAVVNAAGSVTSVVIDNPGTGYSTPPTIHFEPPSEALPPAIASANCVRGRVESINIQFGSHSYLFTPNVFISASSLDFNTAVSQVHRGYKYLDDINDYPTVCFDGRPTENIEHYGAGQRIKTMQQSIRGYVHAGEQDSLTLSEALARDIEAAVDQFSYLSSNLDVFSARVLSLRTDEGLLSPIGVCDVEVEISYVN